MEINKVDLIFSGIVFGVIGELIGHHREIGIISGTAIGVAFGLVLCLVIAIIKERLDTVFFNNRQRQDD